MADKTEGKTEEKKLICIGCPMGCPITVAMRGEEILNITGNTCKHGAEYAEKEVTSPTRVLTTTVRIAGRTSGMLSVKTERDIPKGELFAVLQALKNLEAVPPVRIGDVILANAASTGVDVVATKNID